MRVRFDHPLILPGYAEIFFQSPFARNRITEKSKSSAGQQGVSGANIKIQPFALPSVREQQQIVRRVEALFKLADAIEARVEAAAKGAERLTQAILAKAFRGELVPTEAELARREGRDYEPASVLLERIRADREKAQASESSARKPRRLSANGR
jgi:type I restriction enzyme S subunit